LVIDAAKLDWTAGKSEVIRQKKFRYSVTETLMMLASVTPALAWHLRITRTNPLEIDGLQLEYFFAD
jgi:hypothetical protein